MNVQHTPGPWKYGHLGTDAFWIGPDYDKTPVAHVEHDTVNARDNSRENARLLAAVPELLAALNAILTEETVPVHTGYDHSQNYIWTDAVLTDSDAFRLARAAIAKAKGPQL